MEEYVPIRFLFVVAALLFGLSACNEASETVELDHLGYLEKNAKADGVTVTSSGLQYKVLESGEGKSPALNSVVKVHYEGTLVDGTKFDSSYDRGAPAQFPVNGVIAGWTEALQLMKEGDVWELTIPADIAYGARGAPGTPIGPGATLVFKVELVEVY